MIGDLFGIFLEFFNIFKILVIILDVFLFFLFLYAFNSLRKFCPRFFDWEANFQSLNLSFNKNISFSDEWKKILILSQKEKPQAWRLALILAHLLFEKALVQLGLFKENFKKSLLYLEKEKFEGLQKIERAYKIYTQLLAFPYFSISWEETKDVLLAYYSFFKEMGVLG